MCCATFMRAECKVCSIACVCDASPHSQRSDVVVPLFNLLLTNDVNKYGGRCGITPLFLASVLCGGT